MIIEVRGPDTTSSIMTSIFLKGGSASHIISFFRLPLTRLPTGRKALFVMNYFSNTLRLGGKCAKTMRMRNRVACSERISNVTTYTGKRCLRETSVFYRRNNFLLFFENYFAFLSFRMNAVRLQTENTEKLGEEKRNMYPKSGER